MTELITDKLWAHVVERLGALPYGGDRQDLESWVGRMSDSDAKDFLAELAADSLGSLDEYAARLRSEEDLWIFPAPSKSESSASLSTVSSTCR